MDQCKKCETTDNIHRVTLAGGFDTYLCDDCRVLWHAYGLHCTQYESLVTTKREVKVVASMANYGRKSGEEHREALKNAYQADLAMWDCAHEWLKDKTTSPGMHDQLRRRDSALARLKFGLLSLSEQVDRMLQD